MSDPERRPPALVALAVLAAFQGVVLVAYAVFDIVEGVRLGTTGPQDVSNPAALVTLVVVMLALGVGLLWVARGWWRRQAWARAPFLVTQILGAFIGWELASSTGSERWSGAGLIILAVVGGVLAFLPVVSRSLTQ